MYKQKEIKHYFDLLTKFHNSFSRYHFLRLTRQTEIIIFHQNMLTNYNKKKKIPEPVNEIFDTSG
jgi:hypothetical protein